MLADYRPSSLLRVVSQRTQSELNPAKTQTLTTAVVEIVYVEWFD